MRRLTLWVSQNISMENIDIIYDYNKQVSNIEVTNVTRKLQFFSWAWENEKTKQQNQVARVGLVQYTIAAVFVNAILTQTAVYQTIAPTRLLKFLWLPLKFHSNRFYDF